MRHYLTWQKWGRMETRDIIDVVEVRTGGENGRSFRYLLGTGAAEGFGDALTRTVLPILAVAVLGLGTGFLGILNAIGLAAFLLFGMPIGMAIDRLRNRGRVMGSASFVRFLMLAALTIAYFAGWLSGPLLLGAAVLIGVADVVFTTAQSTVIPVVVEPGALKHAFSRLAVINQSTSTAAAAAGSAMIGLIGIPVVLLTAAAAYAGSCLLQLGIRLGSTETSRPGGPGPRGQFREGFRILRRTPALAVLTVSGSLTNAGAMLGNTVLPVFVMRDLAIQPAAFAALGVLSAVGAITGAAAAPRLTGKLGLKKLRSGASLLSVPAVLTTVACQWLPGPELVWLAFQSFAWSLLISVSGVAGAEVLPRIVPRNHLATVGAAQRTISLGIMPIAALLGGLIGTVTGPVPLLWVWAILAGSAALPIIRTKSLEQFR